LFRVGSRLVPGRFESGVTCRLLTATQQAAQRLDAAYG
jgi:hypothetical protein